MTTPAAAARARKRRAITLANRQALTAWLDDLEQKYCAVLPDNQGIRVRALDVVMEAANVLTVIRLLRISHGHINGMTNAQQLDAVKTLAKICADGQVKSPADPAGQSLDDLLKLREAAKQQIKPAEQLENRKEISAILE
jgi:predicted aconitase